MWYLYLLRCADESFYCGITTDLERRLAQHNGELAGGSRYTRGRRPVEIVYSEHHPDRSSASRREAAVKKMTPEEKRLLVS